MRLAAGSRLGPYEVLAPIGAGGMGEVYRARDTRLGRTVAIKLVNQAFSDRFEREARSISALNHPNVCTLYDVGEHDGIAYLVMEYVEGAPLKGPLPVDEVVRYGVQICDALEAAHRKGIVHRDLKPANILTAGHGIKLLDFGLARLHVPSPSGPLRIESGPTVAALTGAHAVVGTPHYMAPEQIEGKGADARADVFALGCVLYELATGVRAFDGPSPSAVMAAVLATHPRPVADLQPLAPAWLDWVIGRCLEKDPEARWQSARDVGLMLGSLLGRPLEALGPPATRHPVRWLAAGLAIGALVVGLAAFGWIRSRSAASDLPAARFTIALPADRALGSGSVRPAIALSPDGRSLAAASGAGADAAIYRRTFDSYDLVKIAGTDGGQGPFFSPDGRWLAFHAAAKLRKVPVGGGAPLDICDAPFLRGAAWLPDDTIVFTSSTTGGLERVPAGGGVPEPLTTLDLNRHEKTHRSPVVLPGGRAIVFVIGTDDIASYDEAEIVVRSLETGEQRTLVTGGYSPVYSPTGHLLYARNDTVFAVPFDADAMEVHGTAVQVLSQVATSPAYGSAEFDVSPDGTLAYVVGGRRPAGARLVRLDRRGTAELLPAPVLDYLTIETDPSGQRAVAMVAGANNTLWLYDLERDAMSRLTFRWDVAASLWTPDGSHVTYSTGHDIRSISADGSGIDEAVATAAVLGGSGPLPTSWSPDGRRLAVTIITAERGLDVVVFTPGDGSVMPVAATRFDESWARFSPNGRWLAYVSNESGRSEVYVRSATGSTFKYPVTTSGGTSPMWTADRRELIYLGPRGLEMVPILSGDGFAVGAPTFLFETRRQLGDFSNLRAGVFGGSLMPDGRYFLALQAVPAEPITAISVVLNAAHDLSQR
jgi:serine/threonine-protein kinase